MPTLAVVDAQGLFRDGMRALLAREADLRVVAEAGDAEQAYEIVGRHDPDVVLLGVSLPVVDGVAIARELVRRDGRRRVLFLSAHANEGLVAEAIAAGGRGLVSKEQSGAELVGAIRAVAQGGTYVCPQLSRSSGGLERLSSRERQVLALVLRGRTSEEAASQLGISRRTVETHRAHILHKLGVHTLPELFRLAARLDLLRD